MSYDTIRYETEAGIATLTLGCPERLNAFTPQMMDELIHALDRVDSDDDVRVVIVTGAGQAFCSGADLSAGAKPFILAAGDTDGPIGPDGSYDFSAVAARDSGGRVTLRIFRCLKPVIGAINGLAVGVGATMTLPMDIRLASTAARIGFVFPRLGLMPEACSSFFLPRVVGISRALEWCLTGRVFPAEEALACGLVRSLHAPEDLLPAARAIAAEIVENTSPVAVALSRRMLWRGLGYSDPMDAHRVESRGLFDRGRSRDVAEGVASFIEKRPPAFPDRVSTDMPEHLPWWDERQ